MVPVIRLQLFQKRLNAIHSLSHLHETNHLVDQRIGVLSRLAQRRLRGLVISRRHVRHGRHVQQHGTRTVLLPEGIQKMNRVVRGAASGRRAQIRRAELGQNRVFVRLFHQSELRFGQIQPVDFQVNLEGYRNVFHGRPQVHTLKGLARHAVKEEQVRAGELHGGRGGGGVVQEGLERCYRGGAG